MSFSIPSFLPCVVAMMLPSLGLVGASNTITQPDWELVQQAMSLANRVYLFKSTDTFEPNETYYESGDDLDAVAVAVYDDKCIVAFRGTKPIESTEITGLIPTFTVQGIVDILQNVGTLVKVDLASKTDPTKTCSVGESYYNGYFNTPDFEDQIDADCIAQGKNLVLTGHSQGAALAQFAAGTWCTFTTRLCILYRCTFSDLYVPLFGL